MLDKTNV